MASALSALRNSGEQNAWLAVHVLYAQCTCSKGILEHLATRPRIDGVVEKVLLAGGGPNVSPLRARPGLAVVNVAPPELSSRFHFKSAPLLVVVAPDGSVRYVGGYTTRKQGLDPQDAQIIAATMRGAARAELPVIGCAVSRDLQNMLDPFGLKY